MMIDTHCHLDKNDYQDLNKIIKNMGNNLMIVSTASLNDLEEVINLCEKYPNIYGTIGIHPEFIWPINIIKPLLFILEMPSKTHIIFYPKKKLKI